MPQLKTVKLYGQLGKKFGKSFQLAVQTPAEAIKALSVQLNGFGKFIKEHNFHIFLDKVDIDEIEIHNTSSAEVIKIVPVTAGSGGFFKIVIGAVLTFAGFPNIGIGMMLSGVSELLFAPPKPEKFGKGNEKPDNAPSYIFNGAVNTVAQGNPVPLCYGRMLVGSQVISAGLSTREIPV